jgi:hypothetical protein
LPSSHSRQYIQGIDFLQLAFYNNGYSWYLKPPASGNNPKEATPIEAGVCAMVFQDKNECTKN